MTTQFLNFLSILSASVHGTAIELKDPDWNEILNIAQKQSLLPLIVNTVIADQSIELDSAVVKPAIYQMMAASQGQKMRSANFLRVYEKFPEPKPLVVKGIICRQLYGDKRSYRRSGDEDILIRIEDFAAVKSLLEERGFVMQVEGVEQDKLGKIQAIPFFHPRTGLAIEVHLNLFDDIKGLYDTMNSFFVNVQNNSIETVIDGVKVTTMNHTDHFLFLVLHAFKHFIGFGLGIRMILDMLLYQEQHHEEIDWTYVNEKIGQARANVFYNDLLQIGNQYLGFSLPVQEEPHNVEQLMNDIMSAGIYGHNGEDGQLGFMITRRALEEEAVGKKTSKLTRLMQVAFPGKEWLYKTNPKIKEKPWLAVPTYFGRIKKAIGFLRQNQEIASGGVKISDERVKLLRQYGVLR